MTEGRANMSMEFSHYAVVLGVVVCMVMSDRFLRLHVLMHLAIVVLMGVGALAITGSAAAATSAKKPYGIDEHCKAVNKQRENQCTKLAGTRAEFYEGQGIKGVETHTSDYEATCVKKNGGKLLGTCLIKTGNRGRNAIASEACEVNNGKFTGKLRGGSNAVPYTYVSIGKARGSKGMSLREKRFCMDKDRMEKNFGKECAQQCPNGVAMWTDNTHGLATGVKQCGTMKVPGASDPVPLVCREDYKKLRDRQAKKDGKKSGDYRPRTFTSRSTRAKSPSSTARPTKPSLLQRLKKSVTPQTKPGVSNKRTQSTSARGGGTVTKRRPLSTRSTAQQRSRARTESLNSVGTAKEPKVLNSVTENSSKRPSNVQPQQAYTYPRRPVRSFSAQNPLWPSTRNTNTSNGSAQNSSQTAAQLSREAEARRLALQQEINDQRAAEQKRLAQQKKERDIVEIRKLAKEARENHQNKLKLWKKNSTEISKGCLSVNKALSSDKITQENKNKFNEAVKWCEAVYATLQTCEPNATPTVEIARECQHKNVRSYDKLQDLIKTNKFKAAYISQKASQEAARAINYARSARVRSVSSADGTQPEKTGLINLLRADRVAAQNRADFIARRRAALKRSAEEFKRRSQPQLREQQVNRGTTRKNSDGIEYIVLEPVDKPQISGTKAWWLFSPASRTSEPIEPVRQARVEHLSANVTVDPTAPIVRGQISDSPRSFLIRPIIQQTRPSEPGEVRVYYNANNRQTGVTE